MMRLCVFKHVCIARCCGFSVAIPLQARVTLEMVHFDGRAVGGAPEGCARCLMCDVPLRAHFECKEFPGRFRSPKA